MTEKLKYLGRLGAGLVYSLVALGCLAISGTPARPEPIADCNDSQTPSIRIEACTAVIAMGPAREVLAIALMNRAIGFASRGEFEKALADLDAALEANPNLLSALYNRGNVNLDLGRFADADADYSAVIDRAPDFSLAWLNRGLVRERTGDRAAARGDLAQALKLDPSLDAARRALARLRGRD